MKRPVHFRLCAVLCALLVLGCAPAQYIYSVDPVDIDGLPVPLDVATAIEFEDGAKVELQAGERLRFDGGYLEVVTGDGTVAPRSDAARWRVSQVASLLWVDEEGYDRHTKILTPEDLKDLEDIPRFQSLELTDGTVLDLSDDNLTYDWSPDGLALELNQDGEIRSVDLASIHTVKLFKANLARSTFMAPAFWIGTGAAALLLWFITTLEDEESIADL